MGDITQYGRSGTRFKTLDKKLATAIVKILDGELGRKVHHFVGATQANKKRSPKGRRLCCILLVYYSTDCRAPAMYSLEDLEQGKMHGNNLEQFMNSWNMALDSLPVVPEDETLRVKYYANQKSPYVSIRPHPLQKRRGPAK